MTVKEMIEALQKCPQNAGVFINCNRNVNFVVIERLEVVGAEYYETARVVIR